MPPARPAASASSSAAGGGNLQAQRPCPRLNWRHLIASMASAGSSAAVAGPGTRRAGRALPAASPSRSRWMPRRRPVTCAGAPGGGEQAQPANGSHRSPPPPLPPPGAHRHSPPALAGPPPARKGLGVLEKTGKLVPQGLLVSTAKFGWRTAWTVLMTELAPQSKDGQYARPTYSFQGQLGSAGAARGVGAMRRLACCCAPSAGRHNASHPTHRLPPAVLCGLSRTHTTEFPLEKGRYHLYVGGACPWCHRVLLALALTGLHEYIRRGAEELQASESCGRGKCGTAWCGTQPQWHACPHTCCSFSPTSQLLAGGGRPGAGEPRRLGV